MNTESERHYLNHPDKPGKFFLTRTKEGRFLCFEGLGKIDCIKISKKSWKKLKIKSLISTKEKTPVSNFTVKKEEVKKEFVHEVFKCMLVKS